MQIDINQLTIDKKLQPRLSVSESLIQEYEELWKSGTNFPPVQVISDGKTNWLVDGFHRVEAAKRAGLTSIETESEIGDYRLAILRACAANANHGLRRSIEDKRRQVRTLLEDPEWAAWSDRQIADQCLVSPPFVAVQRDALKQGTPTTKTYKSKHGSVAKMKVGAISGSNKKRKGEPREVILLESEEVSEIDDSMQGVFTSYFTSMRARLMAAQEEWKQLQNKIEYWPDADGFKGYLAVKNLFDTEVPYIVKSLGDAKPVSSCAYCNGEGDCLPCGKSRLITQAQLNQVRKY